MTSLQATNIAPLFANFFTTILATFVGGGITFYVARYRLESRRSISIGDWYEKAILLAKQVQQAEPDDFTSQSEREISHRRLKELARRLDEHASEIPGGASREIAESIGETAKECHHVSYMSPDNDTNRLRNLINGSVEKAADLVEEIEQERD